MNNDAVVVVNDDVNINQNNPLIPSDDDDDDDGRSSVGTSTTASATTTNDDSAHLLLAQHVQAKMTALKEAAQQYRQAEQEMLSLTRELCELRSFKPQQESEQEHNGDEEAAAAEFGGYVYRRYLGPEIHHLENLMEYLMSTNREQWNKAFDWVQSCVALRCNDPQQTQIKAYDPWSTASISSSSHPMLRVRYYGTILNGCLRYNTHVTDLTVNMNVLLSGERWSRNETQELVVTSMTLIIQPVLQYIATSPILRRVSFVSDNSTRSRDLAAPFLDATRQNPSIEELRVSGRIPPRAFSTLLSSKSTSITTLSMDCCALTSDDSREDILEKVHLCRAFALRSNTTAVLRNIRLTSFDSDWAYLLDCIAEGDRTARLQQLTLVASYDDNVHQDLRSLVHLLKSSTALQHLTLKEFALNVNDVQCILRGIRLRQQQQQQQAITTATSGIITANDDITTTLTKLSFIGCTFIDDAAARTLINFFQASSSGNQTDGGGCTDMLRPPTTVLLLPELEIHFCPLAEPTRYFPLSGVSLGQAMAALITPTPTSGVNGEVIPSAPNVDATTTMTTQHPNNNHYPTTTIGSQLQVLSLYPFAHMTGFCEAILPHAKKLQLRALHLSCVVQEDIADLTTCLPYLLSLQELHLRMVDEEDVQPNEILELIQQCGNLRTTVTVLDTHHKPLFNRHMLRLAESFGDRNRILSQIRTRKMRPDYGDDREQYCSQPTTKRRKTVHCDIHDNIALMPRLLHAAKQVPYTRVSVLTSALLYFECTYFGSSSDY